MSTKVKRKVTVENAKESDDQPRRPSVFERLGPGAGATQPTDRHSRADHNEKCRNWLRTGNCAYGSTCRFKHETFSSSSRRSGKSEKDADVVKDLRHKVKTKRDEPKESRTDSLSPQRKGSKRSASRSRKGEHESKIKSTVVVTRPRSPSSAAMESSEPKKKPEGNWEDDSDDWPMDAAQLDYKEELTLERKRQQLQRELELELQKERLLNQNVTITKTVSFSESSSSTSSSGSGSISSSSESTSSTSDEESNDSSSSSSSSSSSGSRPTTTKKKSKKALKESSKTSKSKGKTDYDKIKSNRAAKVKKNRSPSPSERKARRKAKDKVVSPAVEKKRHADMRGDGMNVRMKGPRTPSPVPKSRKQRHWAQSSSADSRNTELQRNKGKRHKKKKDASRSERRKFHRGVSPPPLSSPNRTALMAMGSSKKVKVKDEFSSKSRHRNRDSSPPLLPRTPSSSTTPLKGMDSSRYPPEEKATDKLRMDDRSRFYSRKEMDDIPPNKRTDSRDRSTKRMRLSPPRKDTKGSLSPHKDRYESDLPPMGGRKGTYPHEKEKLDRRHASPSPMRRKGTSELDKKREIRDLSPREHELRRDPQYRSGEPHGYDKRGGESKKRFLSPETKKGRDDKSRDHIKERNSDYDSNSWQGDHRKPGSSSGRHTPESRNRSELHSQPSSLSRSGDRERDQDRKKSNKKRDLPSTRTGDEERRLPSPRRSQSPIHGHHAVREIESLTGNRGGRIYDSDLPPTDREYGGYGGYDSLHHDSYINDRLLPSEYESDVLRGSSVYSSEVYPESRYRRGGKDSLDRYEARDVMSPRDVLPHRDIISLTSRGDDYLSDLPIDDRSYDDRWPRGRGRDDWDSYPGLPSTSLPPHVGSALDEDRYGMPRRRRASPEWQRNRMDDRESGGNQSHRPGNRGQGPPRDGRSRSPKTPASNRNSWNDRGGRHDGRSGENKHADDSQKIADDRKGNRPIKKERTGKPKEDSSVDDKPSKEKSAVKRPHSPSPTPAVKPKKKKNELQMFELLKFHAKKPKEKPKVETKPSVSSPKPKPGKQDVVPSKTDNLTASEKSETPAKSIAETKPKEKEERKSRRNDDTARGEDDFSDWSDDDDDLLTREDFVETEGNSENSKTRQKSDDNTEDSSSGTTRKRERHSGKDSLQEIKKEKESGGRTNSKERISDDALLTKESKASLDTKETDTQESLSVKEDTDVDEYITAESVDYDPISDDELDALIEEPDDTLIKPLVENEKSKIVDALDVNWSTLMNETKTEFVPGFARQRFRAAHVLSRIGFSQALAGPELTQKIINICQEQLDEEQNNDGESLSQDQSKEEKKFVLEHPIAAFHVSISQNKRERSNIFNKIGPYRRALCARRDLQMRKLLCKPLNKLAVTPAVTYTPQYAVVDKELYKLSLELLKKSSVNQAPEVNAC